MSTPAFRRIVRRETHSPRTVAMIVAVVLLIAALAYLATEIVLFLIGRPALVLAPTDLGEWLVALPTAEPASLVSGVGSVLALVGLTFLVLAIAPGRLSRHEMQWERRAVVVDNGVIASSLAQHISTETGLSRDDITVGVAHRTVDVTLSPRHGVPLDVEPIKALVTTELDGYQLAPPVRSRVRVVKPKEDETDR